MNLPLDLTVIMYHYVRDRDDAADAGSGIPGMPVREFTAQLDELARHHTFVNWTDVQFAVQKDRRLPSSACLLTFDDGVRDHYHHVFQILRERKISGLFFALDRRDNPCLILAHKIHFLLAKLGLVGLRQAIWEKLDPAEREEFTTAERRYQLKHLPSSLERRIDLLKSVLQRDLSLRADALLGDLFEAHIGSEKEHAQQLYLTAGQIHEMARAGMHFGGHSRSHPWFDFIDASARTREIRASAGWLRGIEPEPWAFAYPYGGLSDDSPALLRAHRFVAAFTTKTQLRHPNPYFIGRLDGEEIARVGSYYA